MEIIFDGGNSHRCVYFNKMVCLNGGLTKYDVEDLQQWLEGGYMCGSTVSGNKFYFHRELFCGDYIESQY